MTVDGGLLIPCGACGLPTSRSATLCPRCGHPFRPAPKKSSALQTIGVVLGLVVLATVGWRLIRPETRDAVTQLASVTGIPVVPWDDRARTAAEALYKAQGATIAESIRAITHPTGSGGTLTNYTAAIQGDQVVSRFDVAWKGGILGAPYVTTVEWRCAQAGHVSARVPATY